MTTSQRQTLIEMVDRCFAARPVESVSEWCESNLVFKEPNCNGPFSLTGREYLREPLDSWKDEGITDPVLVFASRIGKTRIVMGGVAWIIGNDAARILWVMPNTHGTGGAQNVSRTRWQPMCRASAVLAALIPTGARRHEFKALQQVIGGSLIDFAGSNSPANLASNPARVVVLDEVDKFNEGGTKEADAVSLAENRNKEFSNPKRFKDSTPTLDTGLIWQELLKTDLRRRFVPCPHCQKEIIFAWSPAYSVLPKQGCEAYVKWEGLKPDGSWDHDVVKKTAHAECPHCHGKILDQHKTAMDKRGAWRPTQKAAAGYCGWHLPSMYCASVQTGFGSLAVKFLLQTASLKGPQDFINSDLAEPYQSQDRQTERAEAAPSTIVITGEWVKQLTVDCQRNAPHFWHVGRAWMNGDSKAFCGGPLDTPEDIRAIQTANLIDDTYVMLDSGHGAKSDDEIYQLCARFGKLVPRKQGKLPYWLGWMPAKGMPSKKTWLNENGARVPYYLSPLDPFDGTADAGKVETSLFEFSGDYFKDILDTLRRGKGPSKWEVDEAVATEIYWRHMDAEIKTAVFNSRTRQVRHEWIKRSRTIPNHLFDCEVMQLALAAFMKLYKIE